jgi:hypothetical protein
LLAVPGVSPSSRASPSSAPRLRLVSTALAPDQQVSL